MNCLTMRSSSEWKLITASRPPGASTCREASRPRDSSPSSSLTCMRMAWKVRVAGWRPRSRVRTALLTMPASRAVVAIGSMTRCSTMLRAMRPAKRSSPSVPITSRISSAVARASHCAALIPCAGSMRMSSGPSAWKLKPRAASSSCGEDTPRSNRTPRQGRPSPCAATACGSRSIARSLASLPSPARMRAACPPRPKVASTYSPDWPAGACGPRPSPSRTSSTSTGLCSSNVATPSGLALQVQGAELRRQVGCGERGLGPLRAVFVPAHLVPQLQSLALADQHGGPLKADELAQFSAERDAAMAIDFHLGGPPDQHVLQFVTARVQAGQAHDLLLDLLPVRRGVDKEAFVPVGGHHQAALAPGGQQGTMARGDHDPTLVIDKIGRAH